MLLPKEKSIDVRLDETVAIEVEARDPDFALSAVRLRGEVAGRTVLDESLLKAEHRGRFTARYSFVPNAHGLKAGDVVEYWVEADDNRTPKPNTWLRNRAANDSDCFAESGQQPPPDRVARNDRQQPKPGAAINRVASKNKAVSREGRNQATRMGNADKQDGGAAGEQQAAGQDNKQQGGEQQRDKEQGEQKADNQRTVEGRSRNRAATEAQQNAQGGEQKGKRANSRAEKADEPDRKSKSKDSPNDQQKSKGEQTGAGASGSQSSKDAAQPEGTRPDQTASEPAEQARRQAAKGRASKRSLAIRSRRCRRKATTMAKRSSASRSTWSRAAI